MPPVTTPWFSSTRQRVPLVKAAAMFRPSALLPGRAYGANPTAPQTRRDWGSKRVSGTRRQMLNATRATGWAWTIALRSGRES